MTFCTSGTSYQRQEVRLNFHGLGWGPDVMPKFGDTLTEFPDVASTSCTDHGL